MIVPGDMITCYADKASIWLKDEVEMLSENPIRVAQMKTGDRALVISVGKYLFVLFNGTIGYVYPNRVGEF